VGTILAAADNQVEAALFQLHWALNQGRNPVSKNLGNGGCSTWCWWGEGGRGLSGSGALLEELSGHHNGGTWIAPLASSSLHLYF
jgi:hypothetical protein